MTTQELAAELTIDPAQMGYAGMTLAERLAAINAKTASTYFPVLIAPATVMIILKLFPDRINAIADAETRAKMQFKWGQFAATIRSLAVGLDVHTVPYGQEVNPVIDELQKGIAEGIITEQEIQTLQFVGRRSASRAEELWGEGATVTLNDLALVS